MEAKAHELAKLIDNNRDAFARDIVEQHSEREPQFFQRHGDAAREHCLKDARYHLAHLAEAISSDEPRLFSEYVSWAKVVLAGVGIPVEHLRVNIECLVSAMHKRLAPEQAALVSHMAAAALQRLPDAPARLAPVIALDTPLGSLAKRYLDSLLDGDRQAAERIIFGAIDDGATLPDIYLHVFQRTQREIGRRWQMNLLTVAHEHYCTACTQLIMARLSEQLFSAPRNGHTLLAAGVEGELHDLGLRMVADFFELKGWNTIYLGANMPAPSVLKFLDTRRIDVLAIGATMTFHVRSVGRLIDAVRERPHPPRILVGGYPFLMVPDLWTRVGADDFAHDAAQAAELILHAA